MGKPVKRGSPKAAAGSPAKAARVEAHNECAPVIALLAKAEGLSEESAAMLQESAPHCLATPAEDRHAYQKEMLKFLSEVIGGVETKHQAAITAIEAQIAEAGRSAEAVKARPMSTEAEVDARKTERDAQDAATKPTSNELSARKAALAAEQALVDGHAAEVTSAREDHESYSKVLAELWAPLKAGFPGKDWRVRDKLLKQFMPEFQKLQLGAALNSAVPVALKTKVDDRGAFAKSSIDFADDELQKHVAALAAKVSGAGDEAARRLNATKTAEAALASATAAHEKAIDDAVAAENRLFEAETCHREAGEAANNLESAAAAREAQLAEAKASLAGVQELVGQYTALCTRSRPQPEEATGGAEVPSPLDTE